jgi:hypothetical protein
MMTICKLNKGYYIIKINRRYQITRLKYNKYKNCMKIMFSKLHNNLIKKKII